MLLQSFLCVHIPACLNSRLLDWKRTYSMYFSCTSSQTLLSQMAVTHIQYPTHMWKSCQKPVYTCPGNQVSLAEIPPGVRKPQCSLNQVIAESWEQPGYWTACKHTVWDLSFLPSFPTHLCVHQCRLPQRQLSFSTPYALPCETCHASCSAAYAFINVNNVNVVICKFLSFKVGDDTFCAKYSFTSQKSVVIHTLLWILFR